MSDRLRILFVCQGNTCRSPMAEFMMKDLVRYRKIDNHFQIDSAALSDDNIGMKMLPGARKKLQDVGVPFDKEHTSRKMTREDFDNNDYIICMDEKNERDLHASFPDPQGKIHRLFEFSERPDRNIPDPWFTGDFDETYDDMLVGLSGLLKKLKEAGKY